MATTMSNSQKIVYWGLAFLVLHTLLVARTVWFCYVHRREGQVELAWLLFFIVDFPSVPVAAWLLGITRIMNFLWELGYKLIGSGPNLTWGILTGVIGGAQWYFIGRWIGAAVIRLASRT